MKGSSVIVALALLAAGFDARALDLPKTCASYPLAPEPARTVAEIRAEVLKLNEVDPDRTVRLLCATIPRVEREYGADSLELAWWVGSLATPLIAYMDKHDEALPLLDFAEPIFARELGPYANEVADIHVAHAWIDFRKGNLEAAGDAWERALDAREHNPGDKQIELQKALVGLAQVRLAQRDFAAARTALDRAEAILADNGEPVSEAGAAIESAYTALALREEDFATARVHCERLLDIEHKMASPAAQLVAGYAMLGQILERLDEYEGAEQALREAIRLALAEQGAPLQRHLLAALTQLAATLTDRGKAKVAEPFAIQAVAEGEKTLGADAPRLVHVLDVRGEVHRALGELPDALRTYERGSAIVEAHPDDVEKPTRIEHERDLGELYASLGDGERARAAFASALDAAGDDATLATQRADVLLALGELSLDQTTARRERSIVAAVELMHSKLPDAHPAILRAVNELCGLELSARAAAPHCDDAAERLARAKQSSKAIEPALDSAVLGNQSERAELAGDADGAYRLAIESLAAAMTLGTPDPRWRAHYRIARLLAARGDARLATFFGKQSIADIERLRSYFVDDDRQFDRAFLRDKVAVYRTVADWLLAAGRIDEGLAVLRLLKSEELHDFVLRGANESAGEKLSLTPDEQALASRYETLLATNVASGAEIDRLGRLARAERISVAESERLNALLAGTPVAIADRASRITQWIADASRPRGGARAAPPEDKVQSALVAAERERFGANAALAVYLLTPQKLRVLVATREGIAAHEASIDGAVLGRDIGRLLDAVTRRAPTNDDARKLYDVIVRSVDRDARRANADRLVLWPDGALRYVPFAMLYDGESYLGDRYPLQIYADAPATDAAAHALAIRGLGVTRALAGYPALPAMAQELCSIIDGPIAGLASSSGACAIDGRGDDARATPAVGKGVLAGEGFADAAFTKARFESLLNGKPDYSILHLGTHFDLRPGNSLRSFLVLGDGSKLDLAAMNRLDFGGMDLVTLSACQTGLGSASDDDGREVEGLSSIVQRRGARKVIATLWPVEDASTALLMRAFYSALRDTHGDVAASLRAARLDVRKSPAYRDPYYWAGFFVAGGER